MKAYIRNNYGNSDVLKLEDVRMPIPVDHQVLVKVNALSINPAEWHILRGKIWIIRLVNGLFKPKHQILGGDIAGEVVGIGTKVTRLKVGDRVFGRAENTALGEYALLDESKGAMIPTEITYSDGASLPLASMTALDALNQGKGVGQGSKVLINGASGGIGTLAVQIAKSRGAIVHGICSQKNLDLVSELGADHVFDYRKDDFLNLSTKYDMVVDLIGNLNLSQSLDLVVEKGVFVMVGYGGFKSMFSFIVKSISAKSKKLISIDAKTTTDKLDRIGQLVASGKIKPVIDQVFSFTNLPQAFNYLGSRRAKGKVVINVDTE